MAESQQRFEHLPVMTREVLELMRPVDGGLLVDCTVGLGGHAETLLEALHGVRLVGLDRDRQALSQAEARLARFGNRVELHHGNYRDLDALLNALGIQRVQGFLVDLGVSSLQLECAERGFSFMREGPLDMRMEPETSQTAADVVNLYAEAELTRVLRDFGEERRAHRLARALVNRRRKRPFETTLELREVAHQVLGASRPGRIDPATRMFQALRIEVNQELAGLEEFLSKSLSMLESGGRLVVISYHSLEDRMVKSALRQASRGEVDPITGRPQAETRLIEVLTKKPLRPTADEVTYNPRSRSARLRAARRL